MVRLKFILEISENKDRVKCDVLSLEIWLMFPVFHF